MAQQTAGSGGEQGWNVRGVWQAGEGSRLLAEFLPIAFVFYDTAGQVVFLNDAFTRLYGWTREELAGKRIEFVPEHEKQRIGAETERALAGERRSVATQRFTKDGRLLDVVVRTTTLVDRTGTVHGIYVLHEEVTQAKVVEAALAETEHRYRQLLDASPDAISVYDASGRITYLNPKFTDTFGWTLEELSGRGIDFVPEHERERTADAVRRTLAGERVLLDTQRLTKDGRTLDIQLHTTIFHDADGELAGDIVIYRDVTEHRAARNALRQTEQRYRLLLDASPDPISVYDVQGRVEYVNPAFTEVFGWTLGELAGRGIDFVPDDEGEKTLAAVAQMIAGEAVTLETTRLTKDGRVLDIYLKTGSFYDTGSQVAGNIVIYRDVSERNRAERELEAHRTRLEEMVAARTQELRLSNRKLREEVAQHESTQQALRENEERFRELAELLPEIVFEMDGEGRVTFINRRALEVTGYTEAELLGGFRGLDLLAEEDRPRAEENLQKLVRGEIPPGNEYTVLRKDGSRFPAMAFSTPVLHDGELQGFRGIIVDTSRSKQLEEQLRQAAKMEAVGTLAGGIAHDFNNILQAIGGYVQLLMKGIGDAGSQQRMLKQIDCAADRAGELVRSLLAFSRREPAHLAAVDLNQAVREAVFLLGRTIPKMVEIRLELASDLPPARADATQLTQVLMNLGANARDAMPEGGTLTIATCAVELDAAFAAEHPETRPGSYLRLTVRDTGVGMTAELAGQMFDPFFTTKEVGKGTGLGLSTAYGIVKGHQGHILCDSRPGAGTTFTVHLPASPGARPAPEGWGRASAEGVRRGEETVLVVDDEPDNRELGGAILGHYGYQVLEAASGEEALERYRREGDAIDLVVLDLGMPGMGGLNCLRRLLQLNPALRVVVASGYSIDQHATEVLEVGARGFVAKPYRMADLADTVRRVLNEP